MSQFRLTKTMLRERSKEAAKKINERAFSEWVLYINEEIEGWRRIIIGEVDKGNLFACIETVLAVPRKDGQGPIIKYIRDLLCDNEIDIRFRFMSDGTRASVDFSWSENDFD